MTTNYLILGAGIAGIGAGYSIKRQGLESLVLEKYDTYGGLCGNFKIDNFLFDKFVHFSFTNDERVKDLFNLTSQGVIEHTPNPYNLYTGQWLKHPVQNNLFLLEQDEKELIIADFKRRPHIAAEQHINNYEEWLRIQYGNSFAEKFPMAYTRKYWIREAFELETKWIGNRLYQPSLEEVIKGSISENTPITYYAKKMYYPSHGGFKAFLNTTIEGLDIRYNAEVNVVDAEMKTVKLKTGEAISYNYLISSLPLPLLVKMLDEVPDVIKDAASKLAHTSGYQVSIGLKNKNIPPYLWWYIYDEDILPARVYSPSLKSSNNAPEGCSSLQLEVYCKQDRYTKKMFDKSVGKLIKMNIINEDDILFVDIRFEEYANIIFDHHIYDCRKLVRNYLESIGIITIGRFGEWDYFWSDQSLLSGLNCLIR